MFSQIRHICVLGIELKPVSLHFEAQTVQSRIILFTCKFRIRYKRN